MTPTEVSTCLAPYFRPLALYAVDREHRKRGVDRGFLFEREELLAGDIRNELKSFPRELLLTRAYLIIGRKDPQQVVEKPAPLAAQENFSDSHALRSAEKSQIFRALRSALAVTGKILFATQGA